MDLNVGTDRHWIFTQFTSKEWVNTVEVIFIISVKLIQILLTIVIL